MLFSAHDIGKTADTRYLRGGHSEQAVDYPVGFTHAPLNGTGIIYLTVRHNSPHPTDTTNITYEVLANGAALSPAVSLAVAANAASGTLDLTGGAIPMLGSADLITVKVTKAAALADGRLDPVVVVTGGYI